MSRVEPNNRPDEKHQAENRPDQHPAPEIGHTPGEAEGDLKTIEEALKNQKETRR